MPKYRLTKGSHTTAIENDKGVVRRVTYTAGDRGNDILELTEEQAKLPHFRKRVEKVHAGEGGSSARSTSALSAGAAIELKPDEDEDGVDLSILDRNAPEVIDHLDTIADDEDALNTLREAEVKGKNRKSVLDVIDGLIGE